MAIFGSNDDERFNEWLQGMSDEARADVIKARVTETEETRRRLSADAKSRYESWGGPARITTVVALGLVTLIAVWFSNCTYSDKLKHDRDVSMERLRAEHPAAYPPPAPSCEPCPECRAVPVEEGGRRRR